MNDTLKLVLRVAFLVILIWVLAAWLGYAPGASISAPGFAARIGKKRGNNTQGGCRRRRPNWMWGSNGMYGEMIDTSGQQGIAIGIGTIA